MNDVVIAGYARSPFTPAKKGELIKVRPDDLAAQVVRALVERSGVDPGDLEDLLVGCAFPEAEQGFNVARMIGFLAELPLSVAGATVNRFWAPRCRDHMSASHPDETPRGLLCAGSSRRSGIRWVLQSLPNPHLYARYPQAFARWGRPPNWRASTDHARARRAGVVSPPRDRAQAAAASRGAGADPGKAAP